VTKSRDEAEHLLQPAGDLLGQPVLDLRIPSEQLDEPRRLRQAQDPSSRQVAHMGEAVERQQMVFAQRVHRDASGQHQLVIALVVGGGGQLERSGREQFDVRFGHPARRLDQMLAARVFAQGNQEISDRLIGGRQIDLTSPWNNTESLMLQRVPRDAVRLQESHEGASLPGRQELCRPGSPTCCS
jgi:hypothetical protein